MKKNKLTKGRTLSAVVLGLAAVSLIGVGFSAWVIQTQTTADIESVTVSVGDVKNNSIALNGARVTDSSFLLDADVNDNSGAIIYEGTATENDYSWAISFSMDLTEKQAYDASATNNQQIFKGITIKTTEKYTVSEGDTPLYTFTQAESANLLTLPVVFGETQMPLIDKDALNFNESSTTLYYKNASGTVTTSDSSNANIIVTINKALKQDSTTIYTYTVSAQFKLGWGSKYLGYNPSFCDGADTGVNGVFEAAGKTLPTISGTGGIEEDLNSLYGLNGHQINHVITHDPVNAVEIN